MAFAPDGKRLALGTMDPSVRVYEVSTGKLALAFGPKNKPPYQLAFSHNGRILAWGSKDLIILYDALTGHEIVRTEAKVDMVMSLCFTPDDKGIITGNQDGRVRVWDAATLTARKELDARMWMVRCAVLSHDGRQIAAGTMYNTIRLWALPDGNELFGQYKGHDAPINSVAYSPSGKVIASAADNRELFLWDAASSKMRSRLPGNSTRVVAFAPDGLRLATAEEYTKKVQIWDAATGQVVRTLQDGPEPVISVAYGPDGTHVISAHSSRNKGFLHVWEVSTGKHLAKIDTGPMACVAIAPNGKITLRVARARPSLCGTLRRASSGRISPGTGDRSQQWPLRQRDKAWHLELWTV